MKSNMKEIMIGFIGTEIWRARSWEALSNEIFSRKDHRRRYFKSKAKQSAYGINVTEDNKKAASESSSCTLVTSVLCGDDQETKDCKRRSAYHYDRSRKDALKWLEEQFEKG